MITIHSTKKLYAKLPLDEQGLLVNKTAPQHGSLCVDPNPLSGWHANLITLQRRNCVLLVHDATRFPLFIKGLLKDDFANFNWLFEDAVMNTLLKLGANQQQLDAAAALLAPCQFDTSCNRSVQGTMNQMAGDIEHMLRFDNVTVEAVSAYKTAVWLADRPCNVKGRKECVWPQQAMLALLSGSSPTAQAEENTPKQSNNIIQLSDYRRR
ncbi:DUF6933 domain-containing protein [Dasania marina]|uniref:DUF6933 domain-containing protein n=1 Tax=Dasania marina TaxID=471499 RepID=UPI0003728E31|nr:hypothetical protein [Dasania marina]